MAVNPIYMQELDEVSNMPEEQKQRFQITDLSSLTWAMRKLSAIQAQKLEINRLADAEIERIEAYRQREVSSLDQSEGFFTALVTDYAARKRMEDPEYKGDKTPYGKIGFRKSQPKWLYEDEKLLSFLKANGRSELIRIKEEPVKTEIKKAFQVSPSGDVVDENGELVEGIHVDFLPDALDVKVE